MGQVIFDETDKPIMRMTYDGLCDDEEWARHIDQMSEWARRDVSYAVVVDARKVGKVPATQRKGIIDWIDRDRLHLKANVKLPGHLVRRNSDSSQVLTGKDRFVHGPLVWEERLGRRKLF